PRPCSRSLIPSLNSGMLNPGNTADGFDEFHPAFPLRFENFCAGRSEPVVTAPALPGLFDPAAANPAAFFQPIKKRVKRRDIEMERTARAHVDELPDVVTMAGPVFHKGKNEELGAPFL